MYPDRYTFKNDELYASECLDLISTHHRLDGIVLQMKDNYRGQNAKDDYKLIRVANYKKLVRGNVV